mmetsp:Transcript_308/g.1004  ORF Transcript_308/g.1004 Transcript_308/m.1004 type:complete len:368 (+) Transcript_308:190-1293(+)
MTTFDSLPEDVMTAILGFVGFHHVPVASVVNKSWHQSSALTAARVLRRRSLEAAPAPVPGAWNVSSEEGAQEYLSLAPLSTFPSPHAKFFLLDNRYDRDGEELTSAFSSTNPYLMLRTVDDNGLDYSFIVVIDKSSGEVSVYEHPDVDESGKKIEFSQKQHFSLSDDQRKLNFTDTWGGGKFKKVGSLDLSELKLLERYEAVGVFVGVSRIRMGEGNQWIDGVRMQLVHSILVQMPVADPVNPRYPYVLIRGNCCAFVTPEPITRYFAHVDGHNHTHSHTLLSVTNAYFHGFSHGRDRPIFYAPRATFNASRRESTGFEYYNWQGSRVTRLRGEVVWEICSSRCESSNVPGGKHLETSIKHQSTTVY